MLSCQGGKALFRVTYASRTFGKRGFETSPFSNVIEASMNGVRNAWIINVKLRDMDTSP